MDDKGFTLIELIAALAILILLISFVMPQVLITIRNSRIATDLNNLALLNRVTKIYEIDKSIFEPGKKIFMDSQTESEKMEELISNGYLSKIVKPNLRENEFLWHNSLTIWYYSLFPIDEMGSSTFTFGSDQSHIHQDFVFTNSWTSSENDISSSFGRLFIPNNREEYSIEVVAKLEDGSSGGFGVFFETEFNEGNDTGYIVQFDRGYGAGEILVKKRDNGVEQNPPLFRVSHSPEKFPSKHEDPEFWNSKQIINLRVKNTIEPGVKSLDVSILVNEEQKEVIRDFNFVSNVSPEKNVSGFRAWGTRSYYYSFKVN
jgi:prepilin-type N-terminal cleavage/methylation domain-containing protein